MSCEHKALRGSIRWLEGGSFTDTQHLEFFGPILAQIACDFDLHGTRVSGRQRLGGFSAISYGAPNQRSHSNAHTLV